MAYRSWAVVVLGIVSLFSQVGWAEEEALTLRAYRKQAQAVDPQFLGAKKSLEGAPIAYEGHTSVTDMTFGARAYYSDDQRPTQNPNFQGHRTEARTASVGVQKQFLYGPKVTVQQNFSHINIEGASPVAIETPNYYDWYPSVELNVPLWRNFGGRLVRAESDTRKSQASATVLQAESDYAKALARIDMAFYELAAARENLSIQKEILDRAEKIAGWVRGQFGRGLVDPTDVHQANAAVTLRQLQLQTAEMNEASARRTFNLLRGKSEGDPVPRLENDLLEDSRLVLSETDARVHKLEKLRQLNASVQAQFFRTNAEMTRAQVDLQGYSAWYGRDRDFSESQSEMGSDSQPHWYVGLNISAPLDAPRYLRVHRGFENLSEGERLKVTAYERDQQLGWKDFVAQGKNLKEQIRLLRLLEETQKKKADSERLRFQRGRSTTFQVLSFEQDYISAKSQRIQAELGARRYLHELQQFDPKGKTP